MNAFEFKEITEVQNAHRVKMLIKDDETRPHGCKYQTPPSVLAKILEIVFTRAAPAFDNLFMGCVFNVNTVHKAVEKLTFQAFY